MAIQSMTGFARVQGALQGYGWTWEIKSVNARGLDMRFRLAAGFDHLEPEARARTADAVKRGSLALGLAVVRPQRPPRLEVNRDALDALTRLSVDIGRAVAAPPPRIELLLQAPGVLVAQPTEETEDERARLDAAMLADFTRALTRLGEARTGEGARLAAIVDGHLSTIARLREAAAGTAALAPEAIARRLREQIAALLGPDRPLSEDRLAQEIALIAGKADVREELDRLAAHVAQAREMIAAGGPTGRRLDFLCQELNREANTLCSKSSDIALTRIGLDLKAAVEQLREQIQNIE